MLTAYRKERGGERESERKAYVVEALEERGARGAWGFFCPARV
jgi:hypothetical protein